eukprot:2499841-Rhodomonas_salina.1
MSRVPLRLRWSATSRSTGQNKPVIARDSLRWKSPDFDSDLRRRPGTGKVLFLYRIAKATKSSFGRAPNFTHSLTHFTSARSGRDHSIWAAMTTRSWRP